MAKIGLTEISLKPTLEGGQCFRWLPTREGGYFGILGAHCVELLFRGRQRNVLHFRAYYNHKKASKEVRALDSEVEHLLRSYFRIDVNLNALWLTWVQRSRKHSVEKELRASTGRAIRLLQQDVHETLFTFLCSQNNNVGRIATMIGKLCESHGSYLGKIPEGVLLRPRSVGKKDLRGDYLCYSFPSLTQLSKVTSSNLVALSFGYRAPYIVDTCQALHKNPHMFDVLLNRTAGLSEKRKLLMSLSGVGRKVADCVLLFSCNETSIVPLDTHMAQLARLHFFEAHSEVGERLGLRHMTPKDHDAVQAAFVEVFGEFAGWAHSFLFHERLTSRAP